MERLLIPPTDLDRNGGGGGGGGSRVPLTYSRSHIYEIETRRGEGKKEDEDENGAIGDSQHLPDERHPPLPWHGACNPSLAPSSGFKARRCQKPPSDWLLLKQLLGEPAACPSG